jgi:hypothetical protein
MYTCTPLEFLAGATVGRLPGACQHCAEHVAAEGCKVKSLLSVNITFWNDNRSVFLMCLHHFTLFDLCSTECCKIFLEELYLNPIFLRAFLTVLGVTLTPISEPSFLATSADPTFGSASTNLLMKDMSLPVNFEGLPLRGLS